MCVQPVCGSCNVQSKGMLEWVVEQCVQPDLTMAAARVPDRDDVLSVCVCVCVCTAWGMGVLPAHIKVAWVKC